jgi:hypothetical protein
MTGTLIANTINAGAATALTIQSAGTTAMTVDTSQNVGIGTTTPTRKLEVKSTTGTSVQVTGTATTSSYPGFIISSGTQSVFTMSQSASDGTGYVSNQAAAPIVFNTSNTEQMRLDSSGNLLVGTTSTGYSGSGSAVVNKQLTVGSSYNNATATDYVMTLGMNSSVGGVAVNNSATSGTNTVFRFQQNNSNVGSITTTNTATAYNTSSDYRLKEKVAPMTTGLATVTALKPVTYDWISDKSAGEGFIAHELAGIIPLAVSGEKDAVNEDGSIKPQGVDYSKIVVHLVAALQELSAKNDALEAANAAFEARLAALELK